ncbi:MAG: hypothetical protein L3K19_01955 [Thermoplasmata archaeon]|nr:hypothetical protein [Thermoplasmata archaeon]
MTRQIRQELERQVQTLERERPKQTASQMETELARRAPVAYGGWRDETPNLRSRLRAIQRWRAGAKGRGAGTGVRHLFPYLWPVGERQRREAEPSFVPSPAVASGSWRIFLYNCSPEVVRDVRVRLDGVDLDYSPSIAVSRFTEVHWQRIEAIKAASLSDSGPEATRHQLEVSFVIAKGTREARIHGDLVLDSTQGWTFFDSRDGRRREIE